MLRQKPVRGRITSWAAVLVLGLLAATAATGSALTSPPHRSVVSTLPTGTAPAATLPTNASCSSPPGSPTITLSDTSPTPTITIPVGGVLVVMVPSPEEPEFEATDLHIGDPTVLSELCSILLPDHGRRSVLLALVPGTSDLGATFTPPSDVLMPAWLGQVIVQGSATAAH